MLNQFHILLIFFWLLYVVLHSLLAGVRFKEYMKRLMGSNYKFYRLFYSCFAAVSLFLVLAYQFMHSSPALYDAKFLHYVIAIPLALTGLIVMSICIKKYFINLSGVDVLIKKAKSEVLETKGLHAYMRHPLYSGTLLFVWALFMIFPLVSNLVACIIMTVYTLIGIKMEEEKLHLEFGASYKTYASSVPMLIPGFRRKHPGIALRKNDV